MSKINEFKFLLPAVDGERQRFLDLALTNPELVTILRKLPELGVEDCWVVSGGLVQSVWNALCGRDPNYGILDYDIIYFGLDTSWDSEDRVIQRGKELFGGISTPVEIRNQGRVHLWYENKYGHRVPPLRSACQSLWRYPSRTTAIATRLNDKALIDLYAPFGIQHALNMKIQPNRRLAQSAVYKDKSQRWHDTWPELEVVPW